MNKKTTKRVKEAQTNIHKQMDKQPINQMNEQANKPPSEKITNKT